MVEGPIRITRWMIFRRKMLDGVQNQSGKIRTWWKQLTMKREAAKTVQTLSLRNQSTSNGGAGPVIQIGRNSRPPASTTPARPAKPNAPRSRNHLFTRPAPRRRGVINVAPTNAVCPACTSEILATDAIAKCRQNGDAIHASCVSFVHNTCPICKGWVG
jgi:hypothetical protein